MDFIRDLREKSSELDFWNYSKNVLKSLPMKYSSIIHRIKAFFTKKKIIWTIVIVLVLAGGWFFFGRRTSTDNIQTAFVKVQDIQKTVLTTGQVVSSVDLNLSFQGSGVVRGIYVKEGDSVYRGRILSSLDQGNAAAGLESAKGALAQAKANYDKIKAAATSQDIAVSQATVDSAATTLQNAKRDLIDQLSTSYNNVNTAVLSSTNNLFSNPQTVSPQFGISGTVQTDSQAVLRANNDRSIVNNILTTWPVELNGVTDATVDKAVSDSLNHLNTVSGYLGNILNILTISTQITSGGSQTTLTSYQSSVASAKDTVDGASTLIKSDVQSVQTAMSSYNQAVASLSLKQAPPRPEDLAIAEAQVLSAQGQVDSAEATLNNTVIVAPESGTITEVNIKLGELATVSKEAIKLLNITRLHTEAAVSEADIASILIGQSVDNTFDALGPDKHFESKILTINPASTVVSGVVNYKVTASLDNVPGIKPGMTANMTINVAEEKGVLVVPSSAIVNKDGKKFVKVIDNPKTKTYHEVEVVTGLEADGGLTEIMSGLAVEQEIVTYIK